MRKMGTQKFFKKNGQLPIFIFFPILRKWALFFMAHFIAHFFFVRSIFFCAQRSFFAHFFRHFFFLMTFFFKVPIFCPLFFFLEYDHFFSFRKKWDFFMGGPLPIFSHFLFFSRPSSSLA